MTSIENEVRSQFKRVFCQSDWRLFKSMAESLLKDAATLKKDDMRIEEPLKLLARNSRKRLLIGIGVELLLKAVYLKQGFVINKRRQGTQQLLRFDQATAESLDDSNTFTLNFLIQHLRSDKVVQLDDKDSTLKGLRIAKVFRNKETHMVTPRHTFDESNYEDIATSLCSLYRDAFSEELSVRFSLAPNERGYWRVKRRAKSSRQVPANDCRQARH